MSYWDGIIACGLLYTLIGAVRRLALAIEALQDPASGTTLNVGVIGGGTYISSSWLTATPST